MMTKKEDGEQQVLMLHKNESKMPVETKDLSKEKGRRCLTRSDGIFALIQFWRNAMSHRASQSPSFNCRVLNAPGYNKATAAYVSHPSPTDSLWLAYRRMLIEWEKWMRKDLPDWVKDSGIHVGRTRHDDE